LRYLSRVRISRHSVPNDGSPLAILLRVDANARLSSLVPANQERLANVWLRAGNVAQYHSNITRNHGPSVVPDAEIHFALQHPNNLLMGC
jgi:hypothetical protein